MKDNSTTFLIDFTSNSSKNKLNNEIISNDSILNLKQNLANNQGCKRKLRHNNKSFNGFNKCSYNKNKSYNNINNIISKSKYKRFKYISCVSYWLDKNKNKKVKKRTFNLIIKKFKNKRITRCQASNVLSLAKLRKENNKICFRKTAAKSIIKKYKNSNAKCKIVSRSASSSKSNSTSSLFSFISSISFGNNINNNQSEISDENLIHNYALKIQNNSSNNKPRFHFNRDKIIANNNIDEDLISILNTDWLNKFKVIYLNSFIYLQFFNYL
jgi:hypothetical protein